MRWPPGHLRARYQAQHDGVALSSLEGVHGTHPDPRLLAPVPGDQDGLRSEGGHHTDRGVRGQLDQSWPPDWFAWSSRLIRCWPDRAAVRTAVSASVFEACWTACSAWPSSVVRTASGPACDACWRISAHRCSVAAACATFRQPSAVGSPGRSRARSRRRRRQPAKIFASAHRSARCCHRTPPPPPKWLARSAAVHDSSSASFSRSSAATRRSRSPGRPPAAWSLRSVRRWLWPRWWWAAQTVSGLSVHWSPSPRS